ncbi:MAG TPA: cyclic nucleotide-binding domain-containing protein [Thermoanaerobaculia bacterium]|nr:cyclic nucleotide-binding domain-containing protein [Thermoanaerobaculia bacterium]
MSLQDSLRKWDAFSHFSDPHLALLAQCVTRSRFPAGVTIVKEGDQTAESYLIEEGSVSIQRKTPYGLFAIATLHSGDLFGETSFVDGRTRSGDAITVEETDLMTLNPVALTAVMERDQRFAVALYWALWKSLSGKLRLTNRKLTHFFSYTGKPDSSEPASPLEAGDFHVDLASKRQLFQEQKLSNLEINFLTSLSKERKLKPHQVIFREGDPGNEMYVVLEGRVMISKYILGAGEEALAFLERGDYFGEMALIDRETRSADAKADEAGAVVLVIPREVITGILDIQKVSSLRLLKILCQLVAVRLRELDEKVVGWFIFSGGSGNWPDR